MLFLLSILLLGVNAVWGDVIPSRMEGQYAIETFHVVELRVGTPGRLMKLRLDFNSARLVTKIPLSAVSTSYSPFGGGSDVINFAGNDYRLLTDADGGALAASLGCPSCDGVLGLGEGSRLYLYGEETTYTAGAQLVDEDLVAFLRQLPDNSGDVRCLPGFSNICTAQAEIYGQPVLVYFGLPSTKTVVPKSIYEAYTAGLSVSKNDADDFGDLHFTFPSIVGSGDANHFTLRRQDIVSKSRRGGLDLMLESGMADPSTVILSQSAWRSFLLRKNHKTGRMQITSWVVNKHWSVYSLLTLLFESILFLYWVLTPSGAWSLDPKAAWKVAAETAGAALAIVTYVLPSTQTALAGHAEINIFIGSVLANQLLWQAYAGFVTLGLARDFFGDLTILSGNSGNSGKKNSSPIIGANAFAPVGVGKMGKPLKIRPRVYLAMNMANQTILILLAFMLVIETRVETLGGFFACLFVLILTGNLCYHLLLISYIPTGNRITFAWSLYWVNAIVIVLIGFLIIDLAVLSPFIERFLSNLVSRYVSVASFVVYAAVILLASSAAKLRSEFELYIQSNVGKNK